MMNKPDHIDTLLEKFRAWEQKRRTGLADVIAIYREKATEGFSENEAFIWAPLIEGIHVIEKQHSILCGQDEKAKFDLYRQEVMRARV